MVKISDCEEKVLKVIWDCEKEPDLKTVMDAVNKKHNLEWKPQTVSTFLQRLVRKGYLIGRKQGRYWYYTSTVSLEEYRREQLKGTIEFLYDGDVEKLKEDLK